MTATWTETVSRGESARVRLRLISFVLAGLLCVSLAYLAATRRFAVIADLFSDPSAVTVVVEDDPPPPVALAPPPRAPLAPLATPFDATAPATPTYEQAALVPAGNDAAPQIITNATFFQRPSGRDFERYFPARALAHGQSGRVVLDCRVAANGRIACAVESEDPVGWGFGEASLSAAAHFRVAPATTDGAPTSGGRLRVPMTWRAR